MKAKTLCGLLEKAVQIVPHYEVSKIGDNYLVLRNDECDRIIIEEDGSIFYLDRNYYINPHKDGPH